MWLSATEAASRSYIVHTYFPKTDKIVQCVRNLEAFSPVLDNKTTGKQDGRQDIEHPLGPAEVD